MTDAMSTKKPKTKKAPYRFPVELIDQLLAQVENKDAELILGESGLAGQLKKMLAQQEPPQRHQLEESPGAWRRAAAGHSARSPVQF